MNLFNYVAENWEQILSLLVKHIELTCISVAFAILVGVPLGVLICYVKKLDKPILGVANVLQSIPSMALLGFAIPLLGIGTLPAVVIVILYSLLPIIKNTYTGISNINQQTIEAARGIGLTKMQVLTKVQIPLALPVIMAGVRISAVTAVGLMTIAAFIGAGGLGYLVFSGIRTVNNTQILVGAIPACILALAVDYLASIVENLVTPVSLQSDHTKNEKNFFKKRKMQKGILITTACILAILLGANLFQNNSNKKSITISGIDFTEQEILMHMVADVIEENTDITVNRANLLGGTSMCIQAMERGDIDLYVEYSGTGYVDVLKYSSSNDMQLVYDTVKKDFKEKYNIDVLKQMDFNNTYVMAVTKEIAEKFNLKTISDLRSCSNQLKSGTTFEFMNREDGLLGLTKIYELKFKEDTSINGSLRYTALQNKEIDITSAFSTDGLLKKFDLVALEDDKSFFPPYYAIPLVRGEVVAQHPEIIQPIEELGTYLTNEIMMELNYKVDELQQQPRKVAHDFLKEKGIVR